MLEDKELPQAWPCYGRTLQIFTDIYYLYESNHRGKNHGRSTSSKRPG